MSYIIILTLNGKKYLPNLFKSLENLNYTQDKFKIIIVDSGSMDGTLEYMESLENLTIKIIKLKTNLGFAAGNNIGIQHAIDHGAEYIVLLNQDTMVEPDFLTQLIEVAKNDSQIGIVQSLILYYKNKQEINSWGNELHYLGYGWCGGNHEVKSEIRPSIKYGAKSEIKEINYASGAAVLYKTEVLKKIGLFDENYFSYHEDSDLCLRARLVGYKTVLAPNSIVYHDYEFPTKKAGERYFWMEKNRLYLILKFYQFKTLILIWPINFIMSLGQFIYAIEKGYFWQFIKSRLWFVFNLKKLLKLRYQVQKFRQIGDKELMKNFSSEIKYQELDNFLLDKIGNPVMRIYWQIVKKVI